jgi:histone acetyltransferase 1
MATDENNSCRNEEEEVAVSTTTATTTDGDPSRSSSSEAARCIRFKLFLGDHPRSSSFGPAFTHQCLPEDDDGRVVTPGHHRVKIELSPSCERCSLAIEAGPPTMKKRRDLGEQVPEGRELLDAKKAKRDEENRENGKNGDDGEESVSLGSEDTEEEDEEDEDSDYDGGGEEDPSGSGGREESTMRTLRRMSVEEIREALSGALPPIVDGTAGEEEEGGGFLPSPVGAALVEYRVASGDDFVLSLAAGAECADYHRSVQKLAPWFIETADDVDVASEEGGFWRVMYLFRRHDAEERYSLAGYATLFHFRSPFRRPEAGTVVRVCQALILPPYQRRGHGRRMLKAVFAWAEGRCSDNELPERLRPDRVVEVNVEDPAPAFAALRDVVDYERFLCEEEEGKKGWGFPAMADPSADEEHSLSELSFVPLKEEWAVQATTLSRTTVKQVKTVYELHRLATLQHFLKAHPDSPDKDELERKYRLMVKKRLNRDCREELSACGSKQEMQAKLSQLYDETYQYYQNILRRAKPSGEEE